MAEPPVARMERTGRREAPHVCAMREHRPRITLRSMRATGLLLLAACDPASANTIEGLGGLAGGLLHPLLTPTHALALVGLGLLIGQQPSGQRALPQMLFAAALAAGLIALALAVGETEASAALLAGGALCGVLVAAALRLPLLLLGPLAAAIGASIGLEFTPGGDLAARSRAHADRHRARRHHRARFGGRRRRPHGARLAADRRAGAWLVDGSERAAGARGAVRAIDRASARYSAATRLACSFAARSMAAAR